MTWPTGRSPEISAWASSIEALLAIANCTTIPHLESHLETDHETQQASQIPMKKAGAGLLLQVRAWLSLPVIKYVGVWFQDASSAAISAWAKDPLQAAFDSTSACAAVATRGLTLPPQYHFGLLHARGAREVVLVGRQSVVSGKSLADLVVGK